ncbi:WD40-repeat-containing domain protein [Lactifluus subvellereus]|nr:WD40-repeat-containing domain protein [Lactifluus subvellereus]
MPAMPSPVTLPAATIQDDFTTVLSEVHAGLVPSENIWLSCYKDGEPSIHGKIAVSLHERDRDRVELVGTGGVELTRTSQFRYTARCLGLGIDSVDFVTPTEVYADPSHSDERHPRQISSFAISNELLVTALLDGTISAYSLPPSTSISASYPIPTTHVMRPIAGTKLHKSVVNALEILSGTSPDPLLASAGADFAVHLTPLPTSSSGTPSSLTPVLSLKGHLRPVTALLPLRTDSLLSASMDGSLRMWDIRSGAQQAMWTMPKSAVALAAAAASDASAATAWVALANGDVQLLDTRAGTPAAKWTAGAAARAIAASADGREVALGAADGTVVLFNSHGRSIREQWRRGGAPIESISFAPGGRVVVGGEDGLPYVADNRAGLHVTELVFGNVEAVRGLRVSGEVVHMAGDGGVIRKYQL